MKPIAALLVLSLASVGAACSATASGTADEAASSETVIETADAGEGVQGTLNLNVGRTTDEPGRQIVGSGASTGAGGLIVAPGATGGNFQDVPDLGIDLQEAPGAMLEPEAPSDEDDIVRLPPEN